MKLWEKKGHDTSSPAARKAASFTVGNDHILDMKLIPYDVKASMVHAQSLGGAGLLTEAEVIELCGALEEILRLWEAGKFSILPEQEDGHTAIEDWLTKKLGKTGGKIHAGRSRNDQVLTAVRLYEREHLDKVKQTAMQLIQAVSGFGEAHVDVPLPGFTHTRKAMLSSVGLWAGGYAELLFMQVGLGDAIKMLTGKSPLGTAAGFGTTIDLDLEEQAKHLGFDMPMMSATTAQLSRGWVEWQIVNFLAGFSSITARLAADIIRYSGETHGFFELDPAVCTGSSIMPQKKNPDVAELIRGKHAVMMGQATILQNVIQNLESGYHRDLQLTKEPVITAFETILEILDASILLIKNCSVNRQKALEACTPELLAAEAANKLVMEKGMAFRDAYKMVAGNPGLCEGISITEVLSKINNRRSRQNDRY